MDLKLTNATIPKALSMQGKTLELRDTVRGAEGETERVRKEKAGLLQKWTSTVINIAKRDEAIGSFHEALQGQDLKLKSVKAEIAGTKQEILQCQETHDHLTAIEQRADKLCQTRKGHIVTTLNNIEEAKHDLNKAAKAKASTLKTLDQTNEELRSVEKELGEARSGVERMDQARKDLEDGIFLLCRNQLTAEKSSKYTDKIIGGLRDATTKLEIKLTEAQNSLSRTTQGIMQKTSLNQKHRDQEKALRNQTESLHKDLDKVEQNLNRTQALIDKKQNMIDLRQREKAEISSALPAKNLSPLENDLLRVRKEIGEVTDFCNEAKTQWLKQQRSVMEEFIYSTPFGSTFFFSLSLISGN